MRDKLNIFKRWLKKLQSFFVRVLAFNSFYSKPILIKRVLFVGVLFLISAYVNFVFLYQPSRGKKWLSKIYKKSIRQTLQKVDGPLGGIDMNIRVIKLKKRGKIYLEFLSRQADESYSFINSVQLKGSREAYFEYWEDMQSLLLLDDDGDGILDVIAPTFDKFLRPQINLVAYNPETLKFELKSLSGYPQVKPSKSRSIQIFKKYEKRF